MIVVEGRMITAILIQVFTIMLYLLGKSESKKSTCDTEILEKLSVFLRRKIDEIH